MLSIRKSADRGHADHGWLKTFHTFSFADYHDPGHTGFRALRVINEDWIRAGSGFGTHPHNNMEIITYVISGALEHRDSMGNGSVIHSGEVQRMTAGSGITHSEFNPAEEDTHLLQIWILPERIGLKPDYEQSDFSAAIVANTWTLLGSRSGRDGSLTIHQDVELHLGLLDAGQSLGFSVAPDRSVWLQVIGGSLKVNGVSIGAGDGLAAEAEKRLEISAVHKSELLLFDLA